MQSSASTILYLRVFSFFIGAFEASCCLGINLHDFVVWYEMPLIYNSTESVIRRSQPWKKVVEIKKMKMKIKLNYEQLGEWLLWRCEPKMKRIRSVYWVNKNSVGKTLINNIAEFHVISSFSFSSLVEILATNWKHSIRRKHPLVILRIISSGKWYYFTVFFSCKLPKYIILFYMTEKKRKVHVRLSVGWWWWTFSLKSWQMEQKPI